MTAPELTTPWRKIAAAAYSAPKDCRIFGTIEADITETLKAVTEKRSAGQKPTLVHYVTSALARCMHEDIPQINCFVQRGKFIQRENVDVFITVALQQGRDLSGALIKQAQSKTIDNITDDIREQVFQKRSGEESGFVSVKNSFSKIPWPFRRLLFQIIRWWVYDLGFKLPFIKIPRDPFGSVILSDIGSHGLTTGMAALFPMGRLPLVITMGQVEEKPVVRDGEVAIRSILPLTATMDHRIIDGAQAGVLARGLQRRLENPHILEEAPVQE